MDLVIVAVIASAVALPIPYLLARDVVGALRSELRMVADVQQLVADTRRADAENRRHRVPPARG